MGLAYHEFVLGMCRWNITVFPYLKYRASSFVEGSSRRCRYTHLISIYVTISPIRTYVHIDPVQQPGYDLNQAI